MHIGQKIKERRISLGWSQRELAEKMGYQSHAVIARTEAGKVDLPQSRVDQFAKVLGVSHAYLLGLVSEEISNQNAKFASYYRKMTKDLDYAEAFDNLDAIYEICSPEDFKAVNALLIAFRRNKLQD